MAAQQKATWLELAVRLAGLRQAIRAISWAISWAIVRDAIGHPPTVEEVAQYWHEPIRTSYREQAAFRKAFPDVETPAGMFENPVAARIIRNLAKQANRLGPDKRSDAVDLDEAIVKIGQLTNAG